MSIKCRLVDIDELQTHGEKPQPGDMWFLKLDENEHSWPFFLEHILSRQYKSDWLGKRMPLVVVLPNGQWFNIDSRATTAQTTEEGWTVTGEALETLQVGDLRLEPAKRQVITPEGKAVRLTNLEFRLLHLLMMNRGQVLESGVIVDRVWGYIGDTDRVPLKNVVYRLRRKIEPDPSRPRYICSVGGVGYTLRPG